MNKEGNSKSDRVLAWHLKGYVVMPGILDSGGGSCQDHRVVEILRKLWFALDFASKPETRRVGQECKGVLNSIAHVH